MHIYRGAFGGHAPASETDWQTFFCPGNSKFVRASKSILNEGQPNEAIYIRIDVEADTMPPEIDDNEYWLLDRYDVRINSNPGQIPTANLIYSEDGSLDVWLYGPVPVIAKFGLNGIEYPPITVNF
jgi:hypothetical protein